MDQAVEHLIEFGRAVVDGGLLASTCGNVSLRVDRERLAVSTSGSELGAMTADDVAVVAIDDGRLLGGTQPSMELELHRRVYEVRPTVGAVVHCQSQAATLLACAANPPTNLDFIPEVPAYVRAHAFVDYAEPGSEELAASVARAFEDPEVTVVQMQNHGQVIIGSNWRKAVRRGVFFELACWLATRGVPLTTIPAEHAVRLRSYARDV